MKELGNSKSCRALINAKDRNSNSRRGFIPKEYRRISSSSNSHARDYSKQSYLISITIPQPKLGIKIPRFLVKNVRIKFHRIDDHDRDHTYNQANKMKNKKKKKKWTEKLLPKKGASIFSKFFGNKKKSSSSKNDQLNVKGLDDFYSLLMEGTTSEEDQPIFEDEDRRSKVQPQKVSLPLAYFFNMEKNETNKNNGDDVGNSNGLMVIGRQESSRHLIRVPSRKSTSSRRKLRIAIYVRKMGNDNKTAIRSEEGDVGQELCKKRILMGGKCKPLNLSGTLQYDNNGILLPEAIGD